MTPWSELMIYIYALTYICVHVSLAICVKVSSPIYAWARLCQPGGQGEFGSVSPSCSWDQCPAHSRCFIQIYQILRLPQWRQGIETGKYKTKLSDRRFSKSLCWAIETTEVYFWNFLFCLCSVIRHFQTLPTCTTLPFGIVFQISQVQNPGMISVWDLNTQQWLWGSLQWELDYPNLVNH